MHQIKTYCFCLSQTASNINGKGCAGINAPLTLALSVIRGSQSEHKDVLLRTYLICGILQIMASNKVFLYTVICNVLNIVKTEEITVIHTHHRMAAFYISLLGLYRKCVFINTSHNTFENRKWLTRFSFRHANLIACGEMVKKNLIYHFELSEKNITVICNAVKPFSDNIKPDPLIEKMSREGCFVVGNVGRLSRQKGMEYYIQAVPDVLNSYPNARFLIIGDGEEEMCLRKKVKRLGIEEYVFFMGYRRDIQNIMSQLDLVVLSSLWEGLPLTPIEAFSVGKTIVATEVDGTSEIVENGKNGFLVKPADSKMLAEKIIWLLGNPEARREMEHAAIRRYNNKFSYQRFAESYVEYYKNV